MKSKLNPILLFFNELKDQLKECSKIGFIFTQAQNQWVNYAWKIPLTWYTKVGIFPPAWLLAKITPSMVANGLTCPQASFHLTILLPYPT